MNENINLTEILKNVPKGTKLWSPICGDCILDDVDKKRVYSIRCIARDNQNVNSPIYFTLTGKYAITFDGECVLFPSKENRDWATFKVPEQHKHFEPFQKVLVKYLTTSNEHIWNCSLYSHYDELRGRHYLVNFGFSTDDSNIIPYEGNEDKLGKIVEK